MTASREWYRTVRSLAMSVPLTVRPTAPLSTRGAACGCALVGGSQLARSSDAGDDHTVALPFTNPTDVAFGRRDLDRLYVVSIGLGARDDALDGGLFMIEGLGTHGRREPRAIL